ncbi:MAG: MazG nucleotide pyrophosphohydrolase domain-containing protein, partial [Ghiorsea sp.]
AERLDSIVAELGDVLWYVAMVAKECGSSLEDIATSNLAKLKRRDERGTLQGSGDER